MYTYYIKVLNLQTSKLISKSNNEYRHVFATTIRVMIDLPINLDWNVENEEKTNKEQLSFSTMEFSTMNFHMLN